ncbi:MAG: zinc ribbon domain-containing protein [Elusimicrobia bacterium]|nr:zinc ribbon domain-containing protein [Elusimicrobiota bacterium]
MKCSNCKTENKETARNCKKCGTILNVDPIWSPTWKWHAKTLGIIYTVLIFLFFLINWFLKPYLREIPKEVTPWLQKAGEIHK